MPPVIALVVQGILAIAGAISAGIAAGGWIAALTIGALATGAQLVLGGIMHLIKGSTDLSLQSDTANQNVTVKQSAAPRAFLYGKGQSGGVLTYLASTGVNAQFLHLVVTYFARECTAVDGYLFDDYQLVLDGSGNETGKYAGFVSVETKLGAPGEAAFPGLVADTAGLGASAWTSSCRQDGCLSVHYKLKWDQNIFPNGVPRKFGIVARGNKVYDPRTSTTGYSANLALCIRDWMTDSVFGFGFDSATEINDTLYIAAANLADETVTLAAGGGQNRYTCNGPNDSSKQRGDILKGMLANEANGKHGYIAGQSCLWLGAYRAPTLSFGDDDLRGAPQVTGRFSRDNLYNAVRGVYVEPTAGYQATDFPAVVNPSYMAEDSGFSGTANRGRWATATAYVVNDAVFNRGNAYVCTNAHTSGASTEPGAGASWASDWTLCTEIHWKDVEYPFVNNAPEAQRLAKMDLEYGRRMMQAVEPMKLSAYQLQPPDVFQLNMDAMSWVNKTFEVVTTKLLQDTDNSTGGQGAPYLGVDVAIKETDAGVFAWSTADEQASPTFPPPNVQDPTVCQPVTGLTLVSGSATVVTQSDGVKRPRIHVTWNSPTDQFVLAGGKIFVEFKKHSSGTWLSGDEVDGAVQETYLQGVDDGVAYDVRVRARNATGVFSPYATVNNHTVSLTTSHITQGALTSISIGNKNSAIVGGVTPLSAVDAGASDTINIAAFQIQFGFGRVSFNSGSIAGLARSQGYFVYFVDAALAGGAVTYLATTSFDVVVSSVDNVYVGWINTPAAGGSGTSGSDDTGGCCCIDQWLNPFTVVEVAEEGEPLDCWDGEKLYKHPIEKASKPKFVSCVALIADNGCEWRGSADTQVYPVDQAPCLAGYAQRARLMTDNDGKLEASAVTVVWLGKRWVREFYAGKREFAAGCTPNKRIITHNLMIENNPK